MKTPFFSRFDAVQLRRALIYLVISILSIAISIPGYNLTKGSTLFALMYFSGFILFFYALLYAWLKASYYAISIAVFFVLLILLIYFGTDFLVNLEKTGRLGKHGAEDLAWAFGSVFIAGIIAGIIGIFRSRMFKDDDND